MRVNMIKKKEGIKNKLIEGCIYNKQAHKLTLGTDQ